MAAASARLCVETLEELRDTKKISAAASARLCVETLGFDGNTVKGKQPPLRGCVLKRLRCRLISGRRWQPPLRGCVLKQI